jgi:hypothetical protein
MNPLGSKLCPTEHFEIFPKNSKIPKKLKSLYDPRKSAPIALSFSPVITVFLGADDAINRLKKLARVQKLSPGDMHVPRKFKNLKKIKDVTQSQNRFISELIRRISFIDKRFRFVAGQQVVDLEMGFEAGSKMGFALIRLPRPGLSIFSSHFWPLLRSKRQLSVAF